MAGGRLSCLSGLFTYSSVLLLGLCLCDVEASSCQHVMIDKKVGDTVEFSSCLPPEGVTVAEWKYGRETIANKDKPVSEKQFKDRLYLNPTNFSLTVKSLTPQDSGDFSFLSEANNQQRPTVKVTLQVHELITQQPVLDYNFTWHPSNESCTFLLECSASISNINYNWTVRNQTRSGSRLQYILRKEEGDTEFTCTIYNVVSEMSTSETVKCSNDTKQPLGTRDGPEDFIFLMAAVGGGCLIIIILGIVVGVFYCKRSSPGSDLNDLTVYADISEVVNDNESSTMKPCSVYETIDNRVPAVTPGPQTVYDKIQLSRVRKASVSPYQEIS